MIARGQLPPLARSEPSMPEPSVSRFKRNTDLKNTRDNDLSDRRSAAADAKAALLQSYRAAKEAAEPTRLARQEERMAVAVAREERRAERERLKLDEQKRTQAAAAERQATADAAARAEVEAREKAETDRISRVIEDAALRKAARDLRYANRKARQK